MSDLDAPDDGPSTLAFLRELARAPEVRPEALAPTDAEAPWNAVAVRGWSSERFVLRQRLGAGAFGTVYEAFDAERHAAVALKLMRRRDPYALLLFKQEFRALADLVHPNLVQLYELHSDGEQWFFTLELVRGCNALEWVRPSEEGFDEERVRALLRQLAEGLGFLHAAGKLHRDIKPSNVMVAEDGRVVLLDFGLVADLAEGTLHGPGAGTPRYMAPEQAAGLPLGPAADWYAVGVMLHEALTGHVPSSGVPSALGPGVPPELEALCLDLLSPEPERRPLAREVLERLARSSVEGERHGVHGGPRRAAFVGRESHLRRLGEALAEARAGKTVLALLHGPSGMGKSTLAQHFLNGVRSEGQVVLTGRCFEQESVPYKLLDSLVDALCRFLQHAPREEREAVLPRDLGALVRLFPVLRQLAPSEEALRPVEEGDAAQLRRRGAWALRELLAALARRRTLVLFLDDLQWGDLDSVALLLEVLRPPKAPALLLLASWRGDEVGTSPALAAFLQALGTEPFTGLAVHDVAVGELDAAESEALLRTLFGAERGGLAQAPSLAVEARGNPFFLTELARYLAEGLATEGTAPLGLDEVLQARLQRLPGAARRLLEVVSVAGQPLARASASRVVSGAQGGGQELQALTLLRAGQLLRVRRAEGREELLPYHDRIREVVVSRLDPGVRREHHRGLALTLEASGEVELERLVFHFREAGELPKSAHYALQAATRAHEVLAFERAASLYRAALDTGALGPEETRASLARLGEALAAAGRPREAARAHLGAAEGTEPSRALAHRRRAMEQLLLGGYTDEGLEVLERVLREVGLRPPGTRVGTVLSVVGRRAWLRARGLDFRPRSEASLSEDERVRIDTCWAAALGLSLSHPIRAADFQLRHLQLALRAGEPSRIARGLALQGLSLALQSVRGRARGEQLLARARALAEQVDSPLAVGLVLTGSGVCAMFDGDWRGAEAHLRRGVALMRERCAGVPWELDFARHHHASCLWSLGELRELAGRVPALLEDARERGNLHCETMVRVMSDYLVHLAADAPERARETLRLARERWSQRGYHVQHYRESAAQVRLALYEGDGARAWRLVEERQAVLRRSGLLRVRPFRIESHYWHGLAALAVDRRAEGPALETALRLARELEGEGTGWAGAFAAALRSAVEHRRGWRELSLRGLAAAEQELRGYGMALIAAALRRRRGEAMGGEAGRALVAEADAWMVGQSIRAPARMAAVMTPELGSPTG